LRTLLRLELALYGQGQTAPDPASYVARFPDHADVVRNVFRELGRPAGDTSAPRDSAPNPPAAPAALPGRVGRFEVLSLLGEGAFGRVFRARDPVLGREVAVKVPRPGALAPGEESERFLREAQAAATVQHPNVCPVYEVGRDERGTPFIVMALVAGQSLAAVLRGRKEPPPPRQAVQIARKLALALHAAHQKGVVHRDLKPPNVIFDRDRRDVVVMDFGLARHRAPGDARQTQEGTLLGSPAYMAPEQARGNVRAVGPLSDVYALGVVLYEMLAGRLPFVGSVADVLGQVLHTEPEPPSRHRPGVDARLEALCLRALAKDPTRRYPSMKDFAEALGEYLKGSPAEPVAPPAPPAAATAAPSATLEAVQGLAARLDASAAEAARARRRRWPWALAGGLLAAVLVAAVLLFRGGPGASVTVKAPVSVQLSGLTLVYDQSVKYYLDGEEVGQDHLRHALSLKPGRHEVVARRGEEVLERRPFEVGPGDGGAAVKVPPPPEPPVAGRPLLRRWVGHSTRVQGVWWLPGGRLILSSQVAGRRYNPARACYTLVWSPDQDAPLKLDFEPPPHGDRGRGVAAASFSDDGRLALFGVIDVTDDILGHLGDPAVVLYDLDARKPLKDLALVKDGGARLASAGMTADGRLVLANTSDGVVRVLDTRTWKDVRRAEGRTASFSPDGRRILTAKGADLLVWEVGRDGPETSRIKGNSPVGPACWSPDGRHALTCHGDGTAVVWDLAAGKEVRVLKGHAGAVLCGGFTPDGRRVLTGGADKTARLWDVASGKELARFEDHEGEVTALACSPGGRRLVTGCADVRVRLWALPD
jgi:WD40 repeat protein